MTDPNSQSFQNLLHNKPAKVDHNLISFQRDFTLDKKFFNNNSSMTPWPLTRMMFAHVCSMRSSFKTSTEA